MWKAFILLQLNLPNTLPPFLFRLHNLRHHNPQNSILEFGTNSLFVNLDALFEFDLPLKQTYFSALVGDETVHHGLGDVGAGNNTGDGDAVARAGVRDVDLGLFGAGEGGVDDVACGRAEEIDAGGEGAVVGVVVGGGGGGGSCCLFVVLVVGEGVVVAKEGGCKGFS